MPTEPDRDKESDGHQTCSDSDVSTSDHESSHSDDKPDRDKESDGHQTCSDSDVSTSDHESSHSDDKPDRDKESDGHQTCSDTDVSTSDLEFTDSDDRHQQKNNDHKIKADQPSRSAAATSHRHPKSTHTPSLPRSATTSGSPLSLDRKHACQHCPAAFVHFNSLKLHVKQVHGENLQVPVASSPDSCHGGNPGDDNVGKNVVNVNSGKSVERMKDESDSSSAGEKDDGQSFLSD
ncbi:hypothetical protein ACOMHN_055930 [Nucella lapillus]